MAGWYKFPVQRSKTFVNVLAATMFLLIVNMCVFWTDFNHVVKYGHYGAATVPSKIDDLFIRRTDLSSLAHRHMYRFVSSLEDKCKGKDVFLVVVVTSAPAHVKRRNAIRKTWGNETMFPHGNVRILFALVHSDNAHLETSVQREVQTRGDIIQGDFRDSYRNMTTKTVMILRWAVTFCSGAKYVMKTDDDMFVNIKTLVSHLQSLELEVRTDLFMGAIQTGVRPVRRPRNDRYYVSKEDFSDDVYPDYLSGTGYVMSMGAVRRLYVTALMTSSMPMEDVYMGICAERAGIAPRSHSGFTFHRFGFTVCTHRQIVTSHHYSPTELLTMWDALQRSPECGWVRGHFSTIYAKAVNRLSMILPCLFIGCGAMEE
ncbi:beta-1,3-galactosyltransferase 1-like [Branchiostoma floridae]|uniref:Hexosyltransferase n=1 Tax=Branchiostoma floridae TaxID=7739 RepID=A0A9J7MA41_BRAFL|nr:beta-1,3-galactosyltransferase 1-like [Branchiostoma floridae]XP_035697087.1 beta-1,3-galactosyltransferase 1-like [Branchiostoma floridae]XP_035697088.1 beta-1,3-galactosyltransferase 1-like [Branchiostoma floridae]